MDQLQNTQPAEGFQIDTSIPAAEMISKLKEKEISIPSWGDLVKEYDPKNHPVMDTSLYPDVVRPDGSLEKVSRVTFALQKLAVTRMAELCFGVPAKRIYHAKDDRQKEAAALIEAVFNRNRINTINNERANMLFAGCEFMTLWYAVPNQNNIYGIESPIKVRCRNFSPMNGDELYPIFDESGDYVAMSVGYKIKKEGKEVEYFDAYTTTQHVKWQNGDGGWQVIEDEAIEIGKNPTLYCWRPAPIWEDTSRLVEEKEWALSRNGNYLRRNSRPLFLVCTDDVGSIRFGDEENKDNSSLDVMQYPAGTTANYVTWQQAVENLRYYTTELRSMFFTQLQIPDWSYENMKSTPMSGEARKQLFIDAHLKVQDESGRLLELLDREVNVVKAFAKRISPNLAVDIDALQVECEITPFTIDDERKNIDTIMAATGGRPLLSQRQGVEFLGWSDDVDRTMTELAEESQRANAELTAK